MRATVGRLVAGLGADNYKVRQASEDALAALHEKYLDLVLTGAEADDPEVKARLKRVLAQIVAQVEMKQALPSLAPPQRRKLAAFRRAWPALWAKVFSTDWSQRVAAVRSILELKDPKALAEPVLLLGLRHQSDELVAAAAHAACSGQYRSDAIVDALAGVLVRKVPLPWETFGFRRGRADPQIEATKALKQIKSKRASPTIVALLCRRDFMDHDRAAVLTALLVSLDEKRALPHLIPLIDKGEVICTYSFDRADEWTTTVGDMFLITVIRLTGQNHHTYGFKTSESMVGEREDYGFATQTKRSEAVGRFKKWWAANKDKPPYADLKPLKLPDLSKPRRPWELPAGVRLPAGIPPGLLGG